MLLVVGGRLGGGGKLLEEEEVLLVRVLVASCLLAAAGWARLGRMVAVGLMRLLLGIVGRAACRRTRGHKPAQIEDGIDYNATYFGSPS